MRLLLALLVFFVAPSGALASEAIVTAVKGDVRIRAPKSRAFVRVDRGAKIADGTRLKTGADGEATLKFADGSESRVRPKTQIVVRPANKEAKSGLTLFFGRVWTSVVKRVSGEDAFEVRSANAVAGVRGTQFEVGVADDGATRVIVTRGAVGVGGEKGEPVNVAAGYEVESSPRGALARRQKAKKNANWDGWFAARARVLQKKGIAVAKDLDGRLDRRRAQVKRLLAEQDGLRRDIERLEAKKRSGVDVDAQLAEKLAALERVTERIVDMRDRLEAAFGLFEHWGEAAERGMVNEPAAMKRMVQNVEKIAADFADMIEEGTDLSEDGMDEMMKDMEKGGTLRPKKGGAKDELF